MGIAKLDRRIYDIAVARAGVPAERCLFVDDTLENVEAAAALGMRTVHYRTPGGNALNALNGLCRPTAPGAVGAGWYPCPHEQRSGHPGGTRGAARGVRHGRRRESALGWAAVHAFEAKHGIVLPEPYRTFVAEVTYGSYSGYGSTG